MRLKNDSLNVARIFRLLIVWIIFLQSKETFSQKNPPYTIQTVEIPPASGQMTPSGNPAFTFPTLKSSLQLPSTYPIQVPFISPVPTFLNSSLLPLNTSNILQAAPVISPLERGTNGTVNHRFIIKLKSQYARLVSNDGTIQGRLSSKLKNIGAIKVSKVFPQFKSVAERTNKEGEKISYLDKLSLYFSIELATGKSVAKAIEELKTSNEIEVAEPEAYYVVTLEPNDPEADDNVSLPAGTGNQFGYLDLIKAYNGWGTQTGSATSAIAIIDAGIDIDHPDLQNKIFVNAGEIAGNGIDDDNNGFIDDVKGWDFVGSNFASPTDDNDVDITASTTDHGVHVAGIAGAQTNNGIGVAGVGYNTKIMPLKVCGDNDGTGSNIVGNAVARGIVYAASFPSVKVMNMSLGTPIFSQLIQDAINYAVFNKDIVVVSAAGNNNLLQAFYPASFDNVLSVTSIRHDVGNVDKKASYSNWFYTADMAAPGGEISAGAGIYNTTYNNAYGYKQGTSMAAPMVAGAAALVRAQFPALKAPQVVERLRMTSDATLNGANPSLTDLLGTGRLNIESALTTPAGLLKAIRTNDFSYVDGNDNIINTGESISLNIDFVNRLSATSASTTVTASIASPASGVAISGSAVRTLPAMAANVGTSDISSNPFSILISTLPSGNLIWVKLEYNDPAAPTYSDYEYICIRINENFTVPIANFTYSTPGGVCAPLKVKFRDASTGVSLTGFSDWRWDINNDGTDDYIGQQNIDHTYTSPGLYSVKLTVWNGVGYNQIVKNAIIQVGSATNAPPYVKNFDDLSLSFWRTISTDSVIAPLGTSGNKEWVLLSPPQKCMLLEGFNYPSLGQTDDLISEPLDFTAITDPRLFFKYAYHHKGAAPDNLEVQISTNCGLSFAPLSIPFNKSGSVLSNGVAQSTAFIPIESDWQNVNIDLSTYAGLNNVVLKFKFTNQNGNNLYLDNVQVKSFKAEFTATPLSACLGTNVIFTNQSSGAGITGYYWNFGVDALPATASGIGPHSVIYTTSGSKNVSLTVNKGADLDIETKFAYINATGVSTTPLPYTQTFNTSASVNGVDPNMTVGNGFGASTTWTHSTGQNSAGAPNGAAFLNLFGGTFPNGDRDVLFTPFIDFSGTTSAQLSFDFSYCRKDASSDDVLNILYSKDCGVTYNPLPVGSFLSNAVLRGSRPNLSTSWDPGTNIANWTNDYTINIDSAAGYSSVKFAFFWQKGSSPGNNLYIDDIRFTVAPPFVNFAANLQSAPLGKTIEYTDFSLFSPTSWNWTLPGGTPNASTLQHPSAVYNTTVGSPFAPSLTASNSGGTDNFSPGNVLTIFTNGCSFENNFVGFSNNLYTLPLPNTGYLFGTNSLNDKAKAEFFPNISPSTHVTGATLGFAQASGIPGATINIYLWKNDGPAGAPGTLMATKAVTIASIIANGFSSPYSVYFDNPIPMTGGFYVGFSCPTAASGNSVAVIGSANLPRARAWEQSAGNVWNSIANNYGLSLSMRIRAIVTDQPVNGIILPAGPITVCAGNAVNYNATTSTFTGSVGSPFAWTFSGGNIASSTASNVAVTYSTIGTYTTILTSTGDCSQVNDTVQVNVIAPPISNQTVTGSNVCSGSNGTVTLNNSQLGIEYQAYKGATAVGSAVSGTGGSIALSIPSASLSIGANTISIKAINPSVAIACTITLTNTATVNVSNPPTLTVPVIGDNICDGSNALAEVGGSEPGVSYQAQLGGVNIGLPIIGTGANISVTIPAASIPSSGSPYTISFVATKGSCSGTLSTTDFIIVKPLPDLSLNVSGSTICVGSNGTVTVDNSQTGYAYQVRDAGNTTNKSAFVNGTGGTVTLSIPAVNVPATTSFLIKVTSPSCGSGLLSISPSINVTSSPATGLTISGNSVCAGETGIVSVSSSQLGVSYQLRDASNTSNIGSPVSGTGSSLDLITGIIASNTNFRVQAIIPCSTVTLSGTATVSIIAAPLANRSLNTISPLCASTTTSTVNVVNPEINVLYQVRINGTPVGTATSTATPLASLAVGFPVPTFGTYTLSVIATKGSCAVVVQTATLSLTVNEIPNVALSVNPSAICNNTLGIVTVVNSQTGFTYQLRNNANTANEGSSVLGTGGNITLTGSTNITASTPYKINVTNGACGPLTLTTNPTVSIAASSPNIGYSASGNTVCLGSNGTITLSNSEINVNYQLRNSANTANIGSVITGTGSSLIFTVPAASLVAGANTFRIQATGIACPAVLLTSIPTVTVKSVPSDRTVSSLVAANVCKSGSSFNITVASTEAGVLYQFLDNGSPIGSALTGNGSNQNFSVSPSSLSEGTHIFSVRASASPCSSIVLTNTITVDIKPNINTTLPVSTPNFTTGSNGNIILSNSQLGLTYQLRDDNNVNIGSPQTGTGNNLNFTVPSSLLPNGPTVFVFNIRISGGSAPCTPTTGIIANIYLCRAVPQINDAPCAAADLGVVSNTTDCSFANELPLYKYSRPSLASLKFALSSCNSNVNARDGWIKFTTPATFTPSQKWIELRMVTSVSNSWFWDLYQQTGASCCNPANYTLLECGSPSTSTTGDKNTGRTSFGSVRFRTPQSTSTDGPLLQPNTTYYISMISTNDFDYNVCVKLRDDAAAGADIPGTSNPTCAPLLTVAPKGLNQPIPSRFDFVYKASGISRAGATGTGPSNCAAPDALNCQNDYWVRFIAPASGRVSAIFDVANAESSAPRYASSDVNFVTSGLYKLATTGDCSSAKNYVAGSCGRNIETYTGLTPGSEYFLRMNFTQGGASCCGGIGCSGETFGVLLTEPAIPDVLLIRGNSSTDITVATQSDGNIYDDGGAANFMSLSCGNQAATVCAPTPGLCSKVTINTIDMDPSATVFVMDGKWIGTTMEAGYINNAIQLGSFYQGVTAPVSFTSSTGCLTLLSRALGNPTGKAGFEGIIEEVACSTLPAPPLNDECDNAINISNVTGACITNQTYNNSGATLSAEPIPVGWLSPNPGKDVWYKFTAIASTVTINAWGDYIPSSHKLSLLNPQTALYSGTCASLTYLKTGKSKYGASFLNYTGLIPGQTYYIRVNGSTNTSLDQNPVAEGWFDICINNFTEPAVTLSAASGKDCATPIRICDNTSKISWASVPKGRGASEEIGASIPGPSTCIPNAATPPYEKEVNSTWYFFEIATDGNLSFNFRPLNPVIGSLANCSFPLFQTDIDFEVYRVNLSGLKPNCGSKTRDNSVNGFQNTYRCSAAGCTDLATNNSTGLSLPTQTTAAFTDILEGSGCGATNQNNYVKNIAAKTGDVYLIVSNIFSGEDANGNMAGYELSFNGTTAAFKGPTPTITRTPSGSPACSTFPCSVTFSASTSTSIFPGDKYIWSFGACASIDTIMGTVPASGIIPSVSVTYTCGDDKTVSLVVRSNPTGGVPCNSTDYMIVPMCATIPTWIGTANSNWNNTSNWKGGCLPTCAKDARITASPNNPVITTATPGNVRNLTIDAGATLFINANAQLSVCGDITNNGTLSAAANSLVVMSNTTTDQYINATLESISKFGNLTINKAAGTVYLNYDIEVSGSLTITEGILNLNDRRLRLSGNFSNYNGNNSFQTTLNSLLEFKGSTLQTFSNTGLLTLHNVLMNGSAGLSLNYPLLINSDGYLSLINGIIYTNGQSVRVSNRYDGAVNAGNVNSYVQGTLFRSINASGIYELPVGQAVKGYQRATIRMANAGSIDFLTANFTPFVTVPISPTAMVPECSTATFPTYVLDNGYWTISAFDASSVALTGIGQYDINLFPTTYTNNTATYWTVLKNGGLTGISTACPGTLANVRRNNLTGFSQFSVGQAGAISLPIELDISAYYLGEDQSKIVWLGKTSMGKTISHYIIEKSTLGGEFVEIGKVNVSGNKRTYDFTDIHFDKDGFYRLKIVESNGESSYSSSVWLNHEPGGKKAIKLYPNPASGSQLLVELVNFVEYTAKISLIDAAGKVLKEQTASIDGPKVEQYIDISEIASGLYILKVTDENGITDHIRFVRQK